MQQSRRGQRQRGCSENLQVCVCVCGGGMMSLSLWIEAMVWRQPVPTIYNWWGLEKVSGTLS